MKILIAGGGIGGLTAALCCLHHGHEVQVFERASALQNVGAGIQLSPNAMKVFRVLGLEDNLKAKSFKPEALQARMGRSGQEVFNIPLTDHNWDAPYLHIHRAALMEILVTELTAKAPDALMMGTGVASYENHRAGIMLNLSDGTSQEGDIVIAADGIRSVLRAQMLGEGNARFTGNVAWRAVVPVDRLGELVPDPTACVWMGPKRHAVTYHLGEGLINFVGVVEREDWQQESWTEQGEIADLKIDFAGWHPVITNIIAQCDPQALYKWALYDRPPLRDWTDGRAVLLGDAAHSMLPFMAQGAAMAIEDGWAISAALSGHDNHHDALRAYQLQRLPRTIRAQVASRKNMTLYHKSNPLSQVMTYGPMWLGGKFAPGFVRSRFDWLYGYDVQK